MAANEKHAYLASDREAAFAMTAFDKFCIAVNTSISVSVVGGISLNSFLSGVFCVQAGIWSSMGIPD